MEFCNVRNIMKTRKIHKCLFCSEEIPKGSSCTSYSGVWDGEFYNYRFCDRCESFIHKHNIDLSDGFEGGEYWTHLRYVDEDEQAK
jgi:ribosomal protein L24E